MPSLHTAGIDKLITAYALDAHAESYSINPQARGLHNLLPFQDASGASQGIFTCTHKSQNCCAFPSPGLAPLVVGNSPIDVGTPRQLGYLQARGGVARAAARCSKGVRGMCSAPAPPQLLPSRCTFRSGPGEIDERGDEQSVYRSRLPHYLF